METNIDFLMRHTKDTIELYAQGERDLIQTLAELEDNQQLGLSHSIMIKVVDQVINSYIRGTNEGGHERLSLLKSKLIAGGRLGS